MELDYVKGSRKEFFEFVDLITSRDRVAILTHTDLDGLASGIFLEEILKKKNVRVDYIDFLSLDYDMVKEVLIKLMEESIDKVFFCDLAVDAVDLEGLEEMKNEMDVFIIDHHPVNEKIIGWKNVIKTASHDCTASTCFFLGEGLIDYEEWEWLNCAAIFSEFTYKEKKNMDYIKSIYPNVTEENLSSSTPGMNGRKINSALVYYSDNKKYVYELVKKREIEKINEIHSIMEEEIERVIEDFSSKGEHYPEKNLHFYEIDSKFNVVSTVSSLISKMKPEDTFVFYKIRDGKVKFSARNQGGTKDVGHLLKKCAEGLSDALGGGHKAAAGATVRVEDFEEFKGRLLNSFS